MADFVGVVGQQRGHRRQVAVELAHQVGAVVQRRDQHRQVPDGGEDVVAVVAEHGERLGQLDDGVADVGALPAQVVGRGVDESAQRADPAGLGGLQRLSELLQLFAEVVPLDGNRGAIFRDHRAVGHGRPTGVCRRELNRTRGHQRRRQDAALASAGTLYLPSYQNEILTRVGSGSILVDPADRARRGCGRRRRRRGRCCCRNMRRH